MDTEKDNINLMDNNYLCETADCLKLLGHPIRIKILEITSQGNFSVNKIAEICNIPQNQASEHLRLMKNHGLLSCSRDGRIIYYKIKSPQLFDLLECIKKHCSG